MDFNNRGYSVDGFIRRPKTSNHRERGCQPINAQQIVEIIDITGDSEDESAPTQIHSIIPVLPIAPDLNQCSLEQLEVKKEGIMAELQETATSEELNADVPENIVPIETWPPLIQQLTPVKDIGEVSPESGIQNDTSDGEDFMLDLKLPLYAHQKVVHTVNTDHSNRKNVSLPPQQEPKQIMPNRPFAEHNRNQPPSNISFHPSPPMPQMPPSNANTPSKVPQSASENNLNVNEQQQQKVSGDPIAEPMSLPVDLREFITGSVLDLLRENYILIPKNQCQKESSSNSKCEESKDSKKSVDDGPCQKRRASAHESEIKRRKSNEKTTKPLKVEKNTTNISTAPGQLLDNDENSLDLVLEDFSEDDDSITSETTLEDISEDSMTFGSTTDVSDDSDATIPVQEFNGRSDLRARSDSSSGKYS